MINIESQVEEVQSRIAAAAARAERDRKEIRLMAVTKTKPKELVEAAYRAGIRLFGENRVQEAEEKYSGFYDDAELHLIGHLQTNKAKKLVGIAQCVQSIDKLKTAEELEKRCEAAETNMDIYLEFNTSGEESKSGYESKKEMWKDIEEIAAMKRLTLRGLMTIGPLNGDEPAIRRAFSSLRRLFEDTKQRFPDLPFAELSMGMSGDFETAIEEGATLVRVGTALFGAR